MMQSWLGAMPLLKHVATSGLSIRDNLKNLGIGEARIKNAGGRMENTESRIQNIESVVSG